MASGQQTIRYPTLPPQHLLNQINSAAVDRSIAAAQSLPDLLARLKTDAPGAYDQLLGKPLILAKSPAGTLAAAAVSYLAARVGLGWDETTCARSCPSWPPRRRSAWASTSASRC